MQQIWGRLCSDLALDVPRALSVYIDTAAGSGDVGAAHADVLLPFGIRVATHFPAAAALR